MGASMSEESDFLKAMAEARQQPCLSVVFRFNPDVGIAFIVDVCSTQQQADDIAKEKNRVFSGIVSPYMCGPVGDLDEKGNFYLVTDLTILREYEEHIRRAAKRPVWLRNFVAYLDRVFVR